MKYTDKMHKETVHTIIKMKHEYALYWVEMTRERLASDSNIEKSVITALDNAISHLKELQQLDQLL